MIGEYQTTLNYTQLSVPITTDSTLNYLLPVLAKPIVQKIVSASVIGYVYFIYVCIRGLDWYSIALRPSSFLTQS